MVQSLGGATTLFLSGLEVGCQTIKDKNVIGLVDDCGYTSPTVFNKSLLIIPCHDEVISKKKQQSIN